MEAPAGAGEAVAHRPILAPFRATLWPPCRRVQLFFDMDRRQAEQIARLLKERLFAKGETVILEGSGGAAFFFIDSGEAVVSSKGVQVATLGPGDYFGEIALIDGGPARPR